AARLATRAQRTWRRGVFGDRWWFIAETPADRPWGAGVCQGRTSPCVSKLLKVRKGASGASPLVRCHRAYRTLGENVAFAYPPGFARLPLTPATDESLAVVILEPHRHRHQSQTPDFRCRSDGRRLRRDGDVADLVERHPMVLERGGEAEGVARRRHVGGRDDLHDRGVLVDALVVLPAELPGLRQVERHLGGVLRLQVAVVGNLA